MAKFSDIANIYVPGILLGTTMREKGVYESMYDCAKGLITLIIWMQMYIWEIAPFTYWEKYTYFSFKVSANWNLPNGAWLREASSNAIKS